MLQYCIWCVSLVGGNVAKLITKGAKVMAITAKNSWIRQAYRGTCSAKTLALGLGLLIFWEFLHVCCCGWWLCEQWTVNSVQSGQVIKWHRRERSTHTHMHAHICSVFYYYYYDVSYFICIASHSHTHTHTNRILWQKFFVVINDGRRW